MWLKFARLFSRLKAVRWLLLGSLCPATLFLLFFHDNPQIASITLGFGTTRHATRLDKLESIQNATLGVGEPASGPEQIRQTIMAISLPARTDHRDGLVLAAALSNISVDFVDGVSGGSISHHALPPAFQSISNDLGSLGAWRAHLDAMSQIVASGVTTALSNKGRSIGDFVMLNSYWNQVMNPYQRPDRDGHHFI